MKQRICILGGGVAGLTTAYELTNRPGWQERFEITLYQAGWRLGGKGASGVNLDHHDRIEEHGLHIFWGFYENAFRMMREVYDELGRPPSAPLSKWTDAFKPHDLVVLPIETDEGWRFQPLRAPRHRGAPGELTATMEPWEYIPRLLRQASDLVAGDWLPQFERFRNELRKVLPGLFQAVREAASTDNQDTSHIESVLRSIFERSSLAVVLAGRWAGRVALWFGLDLAEAIASSSHAGADIDGARDAILWILTRYLAQVVRFSSEESEQRRMRVMANLFLTVVRGLLADDLVLRPNWMSIDHLSFRQWLAKHGADPEAIHSPLIDGLHAAAYAHGLDVAAGTLLHAILRLTNSYPGALLYKMQAGMGETVIAPLFTVLERRGVQFKFFHRVCNLELSADHEHVARIQMERQVTLKNGARYRPLVDVRGLPCWPTHPLYEQLVEGEELERRHVDLENPWSDWAAVEKICLESGKDFDTIVLAISLGGLPHVASELIRDEKNPRFGQMVDGVRTCQTQSAQLWMSRPLDQLGWSGPPPIVIPFAAPFDTWADMSYLLARERWPAEKVASLAYVTARIDDDEPVPPPGPNGYVERQKARVGKNLETWLERSARGLWPNAVRATDHQAFNWGILHDPEERPGAERIAAQYHCATRNPSDRYVLSAPGTSKLRLQANESGYDNLLLAGDWILTAMNLGCVEAATLGGMQAARALDPGVRAGIGDWLPAAAPLPALPNTQTSRATAAPTQTRELPRFVVRDGDLMATPPINLRISVYNFVLEASFDRLAALCDTHLNLGGTTRYRPLAPYVIVYASSVDNYPVPDPIGWVPETDFGIWVPLVAGEEKNGNFRAQRVVFYTPYIWVSNDVALLNGRLYFGFKKDLGVMHLPQSPERADRFSLDAWVLPRHDPAQSIEHRRILEIERLGDTSPPGAWEQTRAFLDQSRQGIHMTLQALEGLRHARSKGWKVGLDFASQITRDGLRGMRKVFLKQVPDVVDGRKACYQAIVEAEVEVTGNLRTQPFAGTYSCRVTRHASHRIADSLGLVADRWEGETSFHTPLLAGWASFDAQVGGGQVIWETR